MFQLNPARPLTLPQPLHLRPLLLSKRVIELRWKGVGVCEGNCGGVRKLSPFNRCFGSREWPLPEDEETRQCGH